MFRQHIKEYCPVKHLKAEFIFNIDKFQEELGHLYQVKIKLE